MIAVRSERPGDEAAIHAVNEAAFRGHPHSEGREPFIVLALRTDGELALSLVAEAGSAIVGHAAYSEAVLSNGERGWFTLGPIAVLPEWQGEGIGRAMMEAGEAHWRQAGAKGLVVLGDPALYARFGFVQGSPLHIEGDLAAYFQVLAFTDTIPDASVTFPGAFALEPKRD